MGSEKEKKKSLQSLDNLWWRYSFETNLAFNDNNSTDFFQNNRPTNYNWEHTKLTTGFCNSTTVVSTSTGLQTKTECISVSLIFSVYPNCQTHLRLLPFQASLAIDVSGKDTTTFNPVCPAILLLAVTCLTLPLVLAV